MLPWKQDFWISTIISLDRDGWPFVLSNDGRKIPATLSFRKSNDVQNIFFCFFFFPTILAGPRFVETQKFCYHGSVTSPFFYTVGSNSWLGNILDQIISWGKIHMNWKKIKINATCMHRLVSKELLENNYYLRKGINVPCPLLCNIMKTMDTTRFRKFKKFQKKENFVSISSKNRGSGRQTFRDFF